MNENGANTVASRRYAGRLLMLAAIVAAGGALYWANRDALTLDALVAQEARLVQFRREHPLLLYAGAFLLYVAVTGASLPGATAMTLAYGQFFGFWPALALVSFASTGGATLAFLSSRHFLRWFLHGFFRGAVRARFGERLSRFDAALARDGAYSLFTLRMLPQAPFFVVNLAMGLTKMPVRTYWWVSQLGMLPGTCVYVLAGANLPSLGEVAARGVGGVLSARLLLALVALAVFPLSIRWCFARRSRKA